MTIYNTYISPKVKASEIVDPKDESYSKLKGVSVDGLNHKTAVLVADLIKGEMAIIDNSIPEIYKTVLNKANEYVAHIKPVASQSHKGITKASNSFRDEAVLSHSGLNKEYLDRMLEGIMQADPREKVVTRYGVTLTNEDVASLRNGRNLSPKLIEYLIEHYRSAAQTIRDTVIDSNMIILSIMNLHDMMKGYTSYNSDIDISQWKRDTSTFKDMSIIKQYKRIILPININNTNLIICIISTTNTMITIYDNNTKDNRYMHNTIFMIIKRFIYEELLEKSNMSQSECYNDSLQYYMTRGVCKQMGGSGAYNNRYSGNESMMYMMYLIDRIVYDRVVDIDGLIGGYNDILSYVYTVLKHIVK